MDDRCPGNSTVWHPLFILACLISVIAHGKGQMHYFFHLPPQMSILCRRLDQLWEENQGVEILFTWIQFLKEMTVDFLGIQSPLLIARGGSKVLNEHTETDSTGTGSLGVSLSMSCLFDVENKNKYVLLSSGVASLM